MGKDLTGSIKKVTLDGVTFDAAADADFSQVRGQYTNEAVATSGRNMRKMQKRVETAEGVDLITNGAEFDQLKGLSERTTDFPMSYTTAAGDVYRATGWIDLEKRQTMEGKTAIKMFPRGTWEPFLAS